MRLAKMFVGPTEAWLRMRTAYNTWHAAREVNVSRIPTLVAAE